MDDEEKQLHVRIPREVYRKLKVRCTYADTSMQDYIVRLIVESMGDGAAEGGSVLIVEDEAIVRESLRDSLKDSHQITTADTGEEALELIKKQDFDVLVVDVRLPGKSGLQVVREVKQIKPYIKSVVITAYPSVELAIEAMKQGAVDYLIKPVLAEDLEKLIRELLSKRKKANPRDKSVLGVSNEAIPEST